MKLVVFLGPTLPVSDAREILDATYLPPAGQCDLVAAAVNYRPDVIALIDGAFGETLSVWHKEILFALDRGIAVYGASSMGALRAAECDAFGMVGVGEIYRRYASGELMDDDEVALSHATAEHGYRKLSEPMVNVRATFAAAERAGVIDGEQCGRLNGIAKGLHYAERTFPDILRAFAAEYTAPDAARIVGDLSDFVRKSYVDLKRQDAIELLETLGRLSVGAAADQAPRVAFDFIHSDFFETLYNRDRCVTSDGGAVPLEAIGNYVALHDPAFDDLNFGALNRATLVALAGVLEVQVPDQDIETEYARFRARREISGDDALAAWLHANHLSAEELRTLLTEVALCRRMHRWLLTALWLDRSTKIVLDELRLRNTYVEWLARAATHERLLEASDPYADYPDASRTPLAQLAAEHCRATGARIDVDPRVWAEEAGFHSEDHLRMALSQARTARREAGAKR